MSRSVIRSDFAYEGVSEIHILTERTEGEVTDFALIYEEGVYVRFEYAENFVPAWQIFDEAPMSRDTEAYLFDGAEKIYPED